MHMNTYQYKADETALYDSKWYPRVSLMVEAGELVDLWTKHELRGDKQPPDLKEIISEAGDVLWNLSQILKDMGISLEQVAEANLRKLQSRQERGVLRGSGGDR